MSWVRIDDGFAQHPKIIALSIPARWAFIETLCYAARYETDGIVPDAIAPNGPVRAELVASGLWENSETSVRIHDYLDYNPSREERQRERESWRERRKRTREGDTHRDARERPGRVKDGSGVGVVVDPKNIESISAFDEFWAAYPRKVGKPKAKAAFDRAARRVDPDEIVAGARRLADDPNRDPEFTPHPTTWLNRDGWQDDPLPPRSHAASEIGEGPAREHMRRLGLVQGAEA